jgi:hypothetical protein
MLPGMKPSWGAAAASCCSALRGKPPRWFGPALVAALVLAVGFRALFLGETFTARDLAAYYRPAKAIVAPLIRAWHGIPLWNPLFASGQPFAANPEHELFHPLTALLLIFPFEWVFRSFVLLPLVVATGSMYVFARGLGRSRAASLFGGIAWGFGGYLLSTTNLLPILFAACVLPLLTLFAVRIVVGGRPIDVVGMAVVFGAMCLAGEPSTLLATPPIVAAAITARRARFSLPGRHLAVVGALVLGTALGAATLLPGAHHAARTVRARGVPAAVANRWSLPPVRALESITPNVIGHLDHAGDAEFWGARLYPGREFPFLLSLYPALLTTALAMAAGWRRRRTLWPWLAVAAVGFLAAAGDHFPLWPLLRRLPLISGLRYPEKFALLPSFAVVVLATHGFDQVMYAPAAGRRSLQRPLLAVAALALAAGAMVMAALHPSGLRSLLVTDAARLALVALVTAALFRWWGRGGRQAGAAVACLLLAVDLGSAGRSLLPTEPAAIAATPPAVFKPLLGRDDRLLFHLASWEPAGARLDRLASPPVPAQWGLATTLDQDFDLTQLRWTAQASAAFFRAAEGNETLMMALLRRRGVTDVIRLRPGIPPAALSRAVRSPLQLVAIDAPRGFAFAAHRIEAVRNASDWIQTVKRVGEDVAGTACVDPSVAAGFPDSPAPAAVTVVDRAVGRVLLAIDGRGPRSSFIAINQTWDDGWQATLDGAPTALLRTDVDLSGVVVPAGRHQVELVYGDPWVQAGVAVSLAAALACLVLILAHRVRPAGGRSC